MADYQNLFTAVQVSGPVHHGTELHNAASTRVGQPFLLHLAGRLGNAQIGPIYLGPLGIMSLLFGMVSFNIMGMNMLASVNWDPVQFIRQLFWLALEPPAPRTGAIEPGWLVADCRYVPDSFYLAVVGQCLSPRTHLKNGYPCRVGLCCSDLVVSCAGSDPSCVDGVLG